MMNTGVNTGINTYHVCVAILYVLVFDRIHDAMYPTCTWHHGFYQILTDKKSISD